MGFGGLPSEFADDRTGEGHWRKGGQKHSWGRGQVY